jgi:nitrite reductase/ring-hydroxylating ferredoxin subunit
MLNRTRPISRHVEALLSDRRPPRGAPAPDDLGALAAAIELRSMRSGAGMPDPHFVERLGRRLREQTQGEFRLRRELSRRGLLQAGGLAAAAAAAGVVADRLAAERADGPGVAEELAIDGGRWHPVARLDSLPAEGAQRFSTGAVEGVVVNRGGVVEALVAVCTHLGCTLRVDAAAGRLRCPCGPAAFGYGGEVLVDAPNQRLRPLPRIPARVHDGMVEVHVV